MFGFLRQRDFLQLFIALALGTLAGYYLPPPSLLLMRDWPVLAGLAIALAILWWCYRKHTWSILWGLGLLVFLGYINASLATRLPLEDPMRDIAQQDKRICLVGKVSSIPKHRNGHLRFMLEIEEAGYSGAQTEKIHGRCQVYVRCSEPPAMNYGDHVELFGGLEEIEPPSNRGQFNYRAYLLQRGTVLVFYVTSERSLNVTPAPGSLWPVVVSLQRWLTGRLAQGLPSELGELAVSVVYGDKITDLDEGMQERFRRAGLTHILVASGTQVSLLMVLLGLLGWRQAQALSWRGWVRNLLQFAGVLVVLLLYAALTGFETSILRALVMGVLVMFGRLASREVDGMTVLAQAGLVIILINPLLLFAAGFQLSFAATFGLIYINGVGLPRLAHLKGFKHWAALLLLSTGGAQLFVAPILLAKFNQLSLWGLASNLIAIPLAFALLVMGGLASLGLGSTPLIGTLLTWTVWALAWLLDAVAGLFAALPGSNLAVPTPPVWWLALLYIAMLTIGEWIKHYRGLSECQRYILNWIALAGSVLLVVPVLMWWILPCPGLTALSLSKGEAYLWRSPTGRTVLIARSSYLGRNHNADTLESALRFRGINRLHGVIWLDDPPNDDVLIDWPTTEYTPGQDMPTEFGISWLETDGQTWGLVARMGQGDIWLAWDTLPSEKTPAFTAHYRIPLLFIAKATWWEDCPETWLDALVKEDVRCVGCSKSEHIVEREDLHYAQNEVGITSFGRGCAAREYVPQASY